MSCDEPDPWCEFLPALHRTLADPAGARGLPTSYISLDFQQTCAWWETLRYLLRALLGWRDLSTGLAWWYEVGKLDFDDPILRLVRQRWDSRNEVDYFAAREWQAGGVTGIGIDYGNVPESPHEPSPGWWLDFKRKGPLAEQDPYYGGWNSLHLGHSDRVGHGQSVGVPLSWHEVASRRAVLVVTSFEAWWRELEGFGAHLPSLVDRSWHIEVFDRQIGYLGLFRQSRVTKLWFQGKHSIHMAGNPGNPKKLPFVP